MSKKRLIPNIVRGGGAIPIPGKTNYYYMKGRKHKDGGIDIGSNPNTGLEVEDGEVLHLTNNNIKVFSSVPFLNGQSPAEKVMGGENPNKVFKQQENFKDRNNLNDDGTRKAEYGKKAAVVRTPDDEKVSKLTRSYYKEINPLAGYPGVGDAIKHGLNVFGRRYVETDSTAYPVTDKVADATWRKRLGLSYNETDLPSNADGSVRLPKDRELEMPVDTNLLKRRINANLKLSDKYKKQGDTTKQGIVDWAIEEDQKGLDSLRHTYKTGEPVVVNEQVYNTRSLINNGKISMPGSSPLNPLQNYTLQYDKDRNVMMYRDVYDFNHLDWAVPGKGYKIKGEINLNKKAMGGKLNKPVIITANGKTKVVYAPSTGGTRSVAEGNRIKGKLGLITKIGDFIGNNRNIINDGIGLVGNVTGSLLTHNVNRKMLNSLKAAPAPTPLQATKLKTRININPQLDKMRETLEKYNTSIDTNTASSRVALARKNRAAGEILGQYNSLLADKENKETTLINQDRLNRQGITNQNINNYDTYFKDKNNFENKVRELKSENTVSLINNLNSGIQNVISSGEKRRRDRNSLLAIVAANPNVNPQMLKDLGFDGLTQKDIDLINKNR